MKIGNIIQWNYNSATGQGYCIGEMRYSTEKGRVVCIATDDHLGFPIALKWCRVAKDGDLRAAMGLRKRYENRLPGHLKALKMKTAA